MPDVSHGRDKACECVSFLHDKVHLAPALAVSNNKAFLWNFSKSCVHLAGLVDGQRCRLCVFSVFFAVQALLDDVAKSLSTIGPLDLDTAKANREMISQ